MHQVSCINIHCEMAIRSTDLFLVPTELKTEPAPEATPEVKKEEAAPVPAPIKA